MRARTAGVAAGILFAFSLYASAALLWTDDAAMLESSVLMLLVTVAMGAFTSFAMPRPIAGRVMLILFLSASATGLALLLLGLLLGPSSPVNSLTFGLMFVPALLVWLFAYALGQRSRDTAEI